MSIAHRRNSLQGVQRSGGDTTIPESLRARDSRCGRQVWEPESRSGQVRRQTQSHRGGRTRRRLLPRPGQHRLARHEAEEHGLCVRVRRLHRQGHEDVAELEAQEQQIFEVWLLLDHYRH